jgi:hypothetical protein
MDFFERHFQTEAECKAYIHGVEDSQGWEGFVTITGTDYQKFRK